MSGSINRKAGAGMREHQIDSEELIAEAIAKEEAQKKSEDIPYWLEQAMIVEDESEPETESEGEGQDAYNINVSREVLDLLKTFGIPEQEFLHKVIESVRQHRPR